MKRLACAALVAAPLVLALSGIVIPRLAVLLLALIVPAAFTNSLMIVIFVLPLLFIAVAGTSDTLLFLL